MIIIVICVHYYYFFFPPFVYLFNYYLQWDPKITTLPGLYLLSATVLVPCMKIYNTILSLIGHSDNEFDGHDPCSLFALRAVNAVGAPACLYYAYNRCQQLLSQVGFHMYVNLSQ